MIISMLRSMITKLSKTSDGVDKFGDLTFVVSVGCACRWRSKVANSCVSGENTMRQLLDAHSRRVSFPENSREESVCSLDGH